MLDEGVILVHTAPGGIFMAQQPAQDLHLHVGSDSPDRQRRDTFEMYELAVVLSHYDLGPIEKLREYPRGSRRAPKLRITARRGDFLLKRRAPGRSDPFRVAFAHTLQLELARQDYPVARLIGTRGDNNSLLQYNGQTYEMFQYVPGERYDRSTEAAVASGKALGAMHRILASFKSRYQPAPGTFHAADMAGLFEQTPPSVSRAEPQIDRAGLQGTVAYLRDMYQRAGERVDAFGFADWPRGVIHGDWHPGNLLYDGHEIAAVIDFDSARIEPRMADVANAALQFSMRMGEPADPQLWPDGFSGRLIQAMIYGYNTANSRTLSSPECQALPWLMMEALIVESIIPISATGSFARIPGSKFLAMVEQKVRWLEPRVDRLVEMLN